MIKDLGVTLDSKLRFNKHIDTMIDAAFRALGFVLRCGKAFKKPSTLINLFNCFVRSKLEYGSVVWTPYHKIHIDRIERVQKRLTKHLAYRCRISSRVRSYKDRLKRFNMMSLKSRRDMLDMTFLYKTLNSMTDCPSLLSKFALKVPSRVPRYPCPLLSIRFCRTKLGSHSPVPRLSRLYNKLSNNSEQELDIHHDSLNRYKTKLLSIID